VKSDKEKQFFWENAYDQMDSSRAKLSFLLQKLGAFNITESVSEMSLCISAMLCSLVSDKRRG
jgi:hypothetical protein